MAEIHLPPPQPIDHGVAGWTRADDRRGGAKRASRRLRAFVIGRLVRERRLGRLLDRELDPVAIVLHSRRTAGGDRIDHLVVAASGVWVIEARHDRGKVERRRESGRRRAWVRTRDGDRIEIVEACDEVGVVERHLERMGFEWLHVRRAVCLTNANWGMVRRPFVVDGVIVTWGRALVEKIAVPGPLSPFDMRAVAVELSARLPAAF